MRLMSVWAIAMLAANTAVMTPTQVMTRKAVVGSNPFAVAKTSTVSMGWPLMSGYILATKNTPAATMVAAWIRALTGVGPSMASGNQTGRGTGPDLPTAPQKMSSPMPVGAAVPML